MTQPSDALDREIEEAIADVDELDFDADPVAPDSEARADRYASALVMRHRDIERIEARCKARIADINTWKDIKTRPIRASIAWLERSLEMFARSRAERLGAKAPKAYPFFGGSLKLTAPRGSVIVNDPDGFLEWWRSMVDDSTTPARLALSLKDLVVIPPTEPVPDKKAIAKLAKSPVGRKMGEVEVFDFLVEGEAIPGITWAVAPEDSFSVALDKEDQ